MSSARQINANKRNARRCTGPRSAAGKAVSRLNSLTHGAFAADLLLPGEDAPSFSRLEARYLAHFKPASPAETFLVQRMILSSWRLLRLAAMETRILRARMENAENEPGFRRAISDIVFPAKPGETRPDPSPPKDPLAVGWIHDTGGGNTLFKLARYQVYLERSFYRAHKLLSALSAPPR